MSGRVTPVRARRLAHCVCVCVCACVCVYTAELSPSDETKPPPIFATRVTLSCVTFAAAAAPSRVRNLDGITWRYSLGISTYLVIVAPGRRRERPAPKQQMKQTHTPR